MSLDLVVHVLWAIEVVMTLILAPPTRARAEGLGKLLDVVPEHLLLVTEVELFVRRRAVIELADEESFSVVGWVKQAVSLISPLHVQNLNVMSSPSRCK